MCQILWELFTWILATFLFVAVIIWAHYMVKKYLWPDMWPKDKRY